jgi:hypothetical protein
LGPQFLPQNNGAKGLFLLIDFSTAGPISGSWDKKSSKESEKSRRASETPSPLTSDQLSLKTLGLWGEGDVA